MKKFDLELLESSLSEFTSLLGIVDEIEEAAKEEEIKTTDDEPELTQSPLPNNKDDSKSELGVSQIFLVIFLKKRFLIFGNLFSALAIKLIEEIGLVRVMMENEVNEFFPCIVWQVLHKLIN